MLTDMAIRHLKGNGAVYKVADRDGLYVLVSSTGARTFRYDYRLQGRRETVTIGKYHPQLFTLAQAREALLEARRAVLAGRSPAREKRAAKHRRDDVPLFCEFADKFFQEAELAESTKAMRRAVYNKDLRPAFRNRRLNDITTDELRGLCDKIKGRGAPATALHARDITKGIFDFATLKGYKLPNPATEIAPKSIGSFKPRDRDLSPLEIRILHHVLPQIQASADHRLAIRLILLTLVRKGELIGATWDEVDLDNALWTVPKERMKTRKPHNVYLSRQATELLTALKACAGNSKYVLPSRNDPRRHIATGSLNRVTASIVERAKAEGLPLAEFTVHDLRRTGSTLLNEVGFNGDWIEKCLAHEQGRSSRGVYNKAQYAEQRKHMLQEWADMLEAWTEGRGHSPVLLPPAIRAIAPQAIPGL